MSTAPLVKIKATTAAEICATFDLAPDARRLLRDGMRPGEFVAALIAKKQGAAGIS